MAESDATKAKDSRDFLIEEYKTLRAEIETKIADNRKLEIYAVTASALIYSWLATQDKVRTVGWSLAWFLPVFVTGICWFRNEGSGKSIRKLADYPLKIERSFFPDAGRPPGVESTQPSGWEHHRLSIKGTKDTDIFAVQIFWVFLITANLVVALYVLKFHPFLSPSLPVKG